MIDLNTGETVAAVRNNTSTTSTVAAATAETSNSKATNATNDYFSSNNINMNNSLSSAADTRAATTSTNSNSNDTKNGGITLEAIGLTLGGGICISFLAIIFFGIAVMLRSPHVAPRCTARHPNTIYTRRKDMYGDRSDGGGGKQTGKNKKKKIKGSEDAPQSKATGNSLRKRGVKSNTETNANTTTTNNNNNTNEPTTTTLSKPPKRSSALATCTTSLTTTTKKATHLTKHATKSSANMATKLVTGLDLNGFSAAQKKEREEEEWGERGRFVNNSIGQPVYVGDSHHAATLGNSGVNGLSGRNLFRGISSGTSGRHLSVDVGVAIEDQGMNENQQVSNVESGLTSADGLEFNGFSNEDQKNVNMTNDDYINNEGEERIPTSKSNKEEEDEEEVEEEMYTHPQDRGNPFLGWIPWTLHLSYDRMLRGIPGTGTRGGGMGGKLLGVNLDAIVLLRYHALCLRVTAVACFLCLCIILPLNLTACDDTDLYCQSVPTNANLTNYGRTTIANILYMAESSTTSSSSTGVVPLETQRFRIFSSGFWADQSLSHLLRLYVISICTWYLTYYTLTNIKREWTENLVLRRVYYLEADHYGNRQSELDKTVYLQHDDDTDAESDVEEDDDDIQKRRATNQGLPSNKQPKYKNRNPWIPHPEHRDTVPNIELYSVLVGGLPSLPSEVVNSKDMQAAIGFSKKASIDWQLAVATTFFDHCVPNQPGFSSSVVAVTILPGAKELASAWRKWYAAAAALRRLRFIRQQIADKRYYAIDDVQEADEESSMDVNETARQESFNSPDRKKIPQSRLSVDTSEPEKRNVITFLDDETASQRFEDAETRRQMAQYRQTYGTENASDVDFRIFKSLSLNYGPEQQAVYSREMAQGAAACCPNGCCEGRVRRSPIDKLLEMEKVTIERLENAQYELQCAQLKAAVSILDTDKKSMKKESAHDTEILLQQHSAADLDPPHRHSTTYSSSKIRVVDGITTNSSNGEGVELPSFDSMFDSTDRADLSIDLTPKTPDFLSNMVSDRGSVSTNVSSIPGSADKKLDMETQLLAKYGPALPAFVQSGKSKSFEQASSVNADTTAEKNYTTPQAKYSLQTINEDAKLTKDSLPMSRNFNNDSPNNLSSPIPPPSRNTVLRMNSEGKFLFNSTATYDDDEESSTVSAINARGTVGTITENPSMLSAEPSLRRRTFTGQSFVSTGEVSASSHQWDQVNNILRTDDTENQQRENNGQSARNVDTGVWKMPSFKSTMSATKSYIISHLTSVGRWTKVKTDPITSKLAKDSTYAVVTFSSRQAAVAARHCLADGRGVQRWLSVETVPVPPLADAAPCDFITCRGCCRPVTLNLNRNQMLCRRYIAMGSLVFIYIFYTIPITAAKKVVEPSSLQKTMPGLYNWFQQTKYLSADIMSGLVSALLYTTFFALCPVIFKMIANSGSQSTSVQEAEKYALQYYWYFMLITAFVFTGLADAAIAIWNYKAFDETFQALIENIASATPLTTSATWLNWIIVRTTMTLPLQYMLQVNTFIFGWIGWNCCSRCTQGGGPGGPIPYRIYVDGGVVFVCVVALAPQSPLVAPAALLYYLFCVPLWRRNCIFLYRPRFDSGGERWPFLSDVLVTSLFMGQFLLTLQMVLRDAYGPAVLAAAPAIPTYLFRNFIIKRFRRAYDDAGLLQTSLLDGWDNTIPTSMEKREEFRQFLVDGHKAAYIPVCIAGGATNILTAEPAVVIPSENDDMLGYSDVTISNRPDYSFAEIPVSPYFGDQATEMQPSDGVTPPSSSNQRGGFMRRTASFSAHTPRSIPSPSQFEEPLTPIAGNGTEHSRANELWRKVKDRVEESSAGIGDGAGDGDPSCAQS